jgi:hypothetical protein
MASDTLQRNGLQPGRAFSQQVVDTFRNRWSRLCGINGRNFSEYAPDEVHFFLVGCTLSWALPLPKSGIATAAGGGNRYGA